MAANIIFPRFDHFGVEQTSRRDFLHSITIFQSFRPIQSQTISYFRNSISANPYFTKMELCLYQVGFFHTEILFYYTRAHRNMNMCIANSGFRRRQLLSGSPHILAPKLA